MDLPTSYHNSPPNTTSDGETFSQVPDSIKKDKRLDGNAKILLADIASLCAKEGYCWATNAYFAETFGVNERTVMRWIQQLEELKYVTVNRTGKCRKGTERIIKMMNYPALRRNSTPEVVAAVLVKATQQADKHNAPPRALPVRDTKPVTPPLPKMSPEGYKTCQGRDTKSVTQSDDLKENLKKERIKDSSPGAARHPQGVGLQEDQHSVEKENTEKIGLAPVSASPPATVVKTGWEGLTDAERTHYRQESGLLLKGRVDAKAFAAMKYPQRLIDLTAKRLFDEAQKGGAA